MKKIILIFLVFTSWLCKAQDATPIIINLSDNASLQYNGSFVKMKATVIEYRPVLNGTKEFYIKVRVTYYVNNSGAYGATVTSDIQANVNLSQDQQSYLVSVYQDRFFEHQTTGLCADATSGNIVNCLQADGVTPTVNAIAESAYWQAFKLNQVAGITSITTQGALDAEYKIITAIINKMNTRKNW